jgi:hypothetical protein
MGQPIYKFFVAKFSEAWYQLSQAEQESFEVKLDDALEKVGAKKLLLCDTNWSSDQWAFAGIEEFPNIEAVQNYIVLLHEFDWFRYVESMNILGTKLEL